ncbi:MAG TPA: hypothetical protein VGM39_11415 [Kofleriaceae bacterium]
MSDEDDMSYVTRKELREELAPLHAAIADIRDRFATKEDLARFATKEDLARFATKEDLAASGVNLRAEIAQDTARAINAAFERFGSMFRVLDDKYIDLPIRVTRLEAEGLPTRVAHIEQRLFAPSPSPKRAARRTKPKKRRPAR